MITIDDAEVLIKLARDSISTFFSGNNLYLNDTDKFKDKLGVFVTLNKFEKLRGCIGYPEPVLELQRAVIEASRSAAFCDPRFPTVTQDELEDITIEISVLTRPKLIEVSETSEYLDNIKIGKHGLIIRSNYGSGLLLPQVFAEYESTPKEALEMTCQKAGLQKDAWKKTDIKIYSFNAQVFEEIEPSGQIKEKTIS
jgi:uncharacterized protein